MNSNKSTKRQNLIPFFIIQPPRRFLEFRLNELWQYRELLLTLVWRDINVRYKQTILGVAWAIFQPLVAMIIFTVVFSKMAKLPTDNLPAPVFYFAGLLAWTFFSQTIDGASLSLIEGSRLITKVYFPRILNPAAVLGYTTLNMLISSLLFIFLMIYYDIWPSIYILMLPLFIFLLAMTAFGIGSLVSALNVKYRDFRFIVPFMLQIWIYATPIVYPVSMIPEKWRWLAGLNPMVGIVNGFRACLLGSQPDQPVLEISAMISILLFFIGIAYFRRVEDEMADLL